MNQVSISKKEIFRLYYHDVWRNSDQIIEIPGEYEKEAESIFNKMQNPTESSFFSSIKLKKAEEMMSYCTLYGFGQGQSKSWSTNHFLLIEGLLESNEYVITCFLALANGKFHAVAVTPKRIILAQKKFSGNFTQSILLDNLNNINMDIGTINSTLTIESFQETTLLKMLRGPSFNIVQIVPDIIRALKENLIDNNSKVEEDPFIKIKKLKNLLDAGIISKEEFEEKKKELLNRI